MQADPDAAESDTDDLLAMCAEYFARRAESVARCRRALSEYSATPAELPVMTFLTAQFDQLDAAARHGADLVAAVQRDRAHGDRIWFTIVPGR
jgi:hypothetical protein